MVFSLKTALDQELRLRGSRCFDERGAYEAMVETMEQYFGSCTNHGECEKACPKEISIDFIALLNRDYVKAQFKNRRLSGQRA